MHLAVALSHRLTHDAIFIFVNRQLLRPIKDPYTPENTFFLQASNFLIWRVLGFGLQQKYSASYPLRGCGPIVFVVATCHLTCHGIGCFSSVI